VGEQLPEADLCHHVGVLYHLVDPVAHLQRLVPRLRRGLMLDTHVAPPDQLDGEYEAGGRTHRYMTTGRAAARTPSRGCTSTRAGSRSTTSWPSLAMRVSARSRSPRSAPTATARVLIFAER
jgi:hypothetical protein